MEAPHADPNDPRLKYGSEKVRHVLATPYPYPPTTSPPPPPVESSKKDNKRKQPEDSDETTSMSVEQRRSTRNKVFPKFLQYESKTEGPGVETNKKKTIKNRPKVAYKPVKDTSRKTKRDTKRTKKDDQRDSSSLIDAAKNLVKKGVKKVRTLTGTSVKYVKKSISQLLNASAVNLNINITATMIKNFLVENKDKLFGMKGKIIRSMIERANSIDQGNSLYGCGSGKTFKTTINSFNWSSSGDNDGLVYCWATKVPCAFNLGKVDMAGHGLNHEMEHAVACIRQFMINCLAQIKNLPNDDESIYRRYHNILIEVLKEYISGIGEDTINKYVYYIFKMFRRQQVILGLPSISLFNQIKCAINLIDIDFKNENGYLSFRLSPNKNLVKKTAQDMDSKESKKFNSPCNMIGSKHKDSAFNSGQKKRLTEYYEGTYKDSHDRPDPALVSKAVKIATSFAGMSTKDKEKLLMEQCKKICDEYNSLFDGHSKLSSICSACSIVIVTTIMKSTYVELEIDTKTVPELISWSEKALEFLKSNINYLDKNDVLVHIDTKLGDLLAKSQGNVSTEKYLRMDDQTIQDLVNKMILPQAGGGNLMPSTRNSMKNKSSSFIYKKYPKLKRESTRISQYNKSKLLRVVDERIQTKQNDYYEIYDEYILSKRENDLSHTMNKFLDLLDCQFTEDEFLDVLVQYDGYDKLDLTDKLGEVTILEDIEELETMNEYIADRFVCSIECEDEILLPEEVIRDLNSIVNDTARSKKSVKARKTKKKHTKRKNKK